LSQRRGESEAQAVRAELKLVKQDLSNQIEALDKRLTELKADLKSSDKEQAEQTRREILAEIRVLKAETQNPNNRAKSATEGA
jgi:hypothetical protein